ncbi:MAG: WYL domain-containing protein [Clostridia bacterium]|nr:WYL domain-containing protein [Clostridia bacterium]
MTIPVKKLIIMNILDILRRYSDEDHRLSQKDIVDILKTEYNMTVERKTIRRNILNLMDCGYEIEYSESVRMVPNSKIGELEESYIWTDFYLVRDFSDSELRLLIDGLIFSKHIPYSQCKELVEKLEGLSNTYFRSRVKHIRTMPENAPENKQLFYTIEVLDEAISKGKKVSFHYNSFWLDKTLHPRENREGGIKEYIVSPYQIAATNGRYYLICNTDPHDNVSHYRLDRITDIRLLDDAARAADSVQGLEHGINLPKHMAEHLYMFSGESEPVTFRMKKHILNDVIDWFGTDVRFSDESDDEVTARVEVNLCAMKLWAIQYGPYVKVLSPQTLAEEVKQGLEMALKQYDEPRNPI